MRFRPLATASMCLGLLWPGVLAGCGGGSGDGPGEPERPADLRLAFESGTDNTGEESATVRALTGEGAELAEDEAPDGSGALRFPEHDDESPGLGVLVVLPDGDDFLSPGDGDFEFGVDFSVDAESEGGPDNGNNLVQRGLFSDPAQYKLQIDKGRVSCRVLGSEGEAVVESTSPVEPETWYRVTCRRAGEALTLGVAELDGSGRPGEPEVAEVSTPTGSVTFDATAPLAVGGKVSPAVELVPSSPDQFNGRLDNVHFTLLD